MDLLISLFEPIVTFIGKHVSPLLEPAYKAGVKFFSSIGPDATIWLFLMLFGIGGALVLRSLCISSGPAKADPAPLHSEYAEMHLLAELDSPSDHF